MRAHRLALAVLAGAVLAACGSAPKKPPAPPPVTPGAPQPATPPAPANHGSTAPRVSPYAPAQEDLSKRGNYVAGGLYAPGVRDTVPDYIPDVDAIPEPQVEHLPRSRYGNRSPYVVLGKSYTVMDDHRGYVEQGRASYYGNKFHGRRTSNQEVYDMYAFTAAHRSLPLPSFARVTNLDNGKSVIVRVNDRGPFHANRLIDLSYAAAVKLGFREAGTARVEVRALLPEDMATSAPVSVAAATAAAAGTDSRDSRGNYRFPLRQNGQTLSADQFDTWMQQNRLRIATGRPGTPQPAATAAATPATSAAAVSAAPVSPAPVTSAVPAAPAPAHVELQVASFANAGNAQRALGRLQQAGVPEARLHDALVNGQRIWRLRVGPLSEPHASSLASRIAGLGFGLPTLVRH